MYIYICQFPLRYDRFYAVQLKYYKCCSFLHSYNINDRNISKGVWLLKPILVEALCSSSYSMLGSELHCSESRSSISRILLPVCYFYLYVSKCVREAEETPSHLCLPLWKPLMTKRPSNHGLNHVNCMSVYAHISTMWKSKDQRIVRSDRLTYRSCISCK